MILEHDPQLARAVFDVARPERTTYHQWLGEVEELASQLGIELRKKTGSRPAMVILSVKVPPRVKEKLILLADREGIAVSELVRHIIIDYLKKRWSL